MPLTHVRFTKLYHFVKVHRVHGPFLNAKTVKTSQKFQQRQEWHLLDKNVPISQHQTKMVCTLLVR
jgi:hypothetical protein